MNSESDGEDAGTLPKEATEDGEPDANSECDGEDAKALAAGAENLDDDMVDLDDVEEGRHSAKASFMAKVHSPLLGYGTDYELMQYVWDLNMWSHLGGAKNAVQGTPLRVPTSLL